MFSSVIAIPDVIRQSDNADQIISFLKQIQPLQSFNVLTKFKCLSEEWTTCKAIRNNNSWLLKFETDAEGATNAEYDDDDEKNSLLRAENWRIGWY